MDTSMLPGLSRLLLALESTLLLVGLPLVVLALRDARDARRPARSRVESRDHQRTPRHDRRA